MMLKTLFDTIIIIADICSYITPHTTPMYGCVYWCYVPLYGGHGMLQRLVFFHATTVFMNLCM